ncbi:hypothetical protein BXE05_13695 [Salmonella enterica subsp. enterica]|nr:hypothetical protein [Salmonella enterica subsp. enterica serovar Newport]EBQ9452659.1 hypothetical protein [Salmonella enterica subsp. enterica serovar Newport]EBW5250523.1 hypothetical protein [Salmonella enterica subsp. enterica serovar Newport]MIV34753.1 hypothetical protein [Salmonella enterica subsp. enterica serovar Newport]
MSKRVISTGGVPTTVPSPSDVPVAATTSTAGTVKQMTFTAQLTAAPTQADFNALLTKLIAAGHMASS